MNKKSAVYLIGFNLAMTVAAVSSAACALEDNLALAPKNADASGVAGMVRGTHATLTTLNNSFISTIKELVGVDETAAAEFKQGLVDGYTTAKEYIKEEDAAVEDALPDAGIPEDVKETVRGILRKLGL